MKIVFEYIFYNIFSSVYLNERSEYFSKVFVTIGRYADNSNNVYNKQQLLLCNKIIIYILYYTHNMYIYIR